MKPSGLGLIERSVHVEAALWRRLRFENDATCRESLFNLYLPHALRIAHAEWRKLPIPGCDRRDFEQFAFSGLLEAIDRYDPLRGAPFPAFAKYRIRGAIIDERSRGSEEAARRSASRRARAERISSLLDAAPAASAEPGADADALAELSRLVVALAIGLAAETANAVPATLEDAEAAMAIPQYDAGAWRDLCLSVRREIDRLPPSERAVVSHHYFNGLAFCDIARMAGVTPGRIAQMHRKALSRLRESLGCLE